MGLFVNIKKRHNGKAVINLNEALQNGEVTIDEASEHLVKILKCDASGEKYAFVDFGQRASVA